MAFDDAANGDVNFYYVDNIEFSEAAQDALNHMAAELAMYGMHITLSNYSVVFKLSGLPYTHSQLRFGSYW